MSAATILDRPHAGLLDWLASHGVEHEVHEHPEAFTARQTASAEGVDPATFTKVVVVGTEDDRTAMLLVDAIDQVDLHKARAILDAKDVRLLAEPDAAALTPGCETGAVPALGALFDLPMFADYAVRDDPVISFNAGSHRFSVRVDRVAWERATGVLYADLAIDDDIRPTWART
ncbi:MAG: YbaK/EbsC family protein [Chloroflexota bacterium]|nr:YbaK/EbsC family protein [Chloroflexota bacterium]MDH5242633.1 YbaK/EbsC family protein [Chloroflexota bacterium]